MTGLRIVRVAAGDYETADGKYRLYQLVDVHPRAWNVEEITDDGSENLIVDGAATKRDAVALLADHLREEMSLRPRPGETAAQVIDRVVAAARMYS